MLGLLQPWIVSFILINVILTVANLAVMGHRNGFNDSDIAREIQWGLAIVQIIAGIALLTVSIWYLCIQHKLL